MSMRSDASLVSGMSDTSFLWSSETVEVRTRGLWSLWGWATQDAPELYSLVPTETSNGDLDSSPSAKVHDRDDIPSGVEIWRNSHSMIFVFDSNLEMLVWSEGMTRVRIVWSC